MANTFTKIASVTVGSGGASSIVFSSIPQTYTDLVIFTSARSTSSGINSDDIQINGSGTSAGKRIIAEVGTIYAQNATGGYVDYANATANTFSNESVYIPNYTVAQAHSYSTDSVMENNSTNQGMGIMTGLSTSTSAITSITIVTAGGADNFVQYTTSTLYGIKNS